MEIAVDVTIEGTKEEVWDVITDIENSSQTISGINQIEILEKPSDGLVGLKWQETRTMFGRTATEVMWITEADENQFYKTRAESHGAVYVTKLAITEQGDKVRLAMNFGSQPQTFGARLMAALTAPFFTNASREALQRDLEDIKAAVEKKE